MQSQPDDIIRVIGSHLKFRSLVKFSLTCKRYRDALAGLLARRKDALLSPRVFASTNGAVLFFRPGPVLRLPARFPVDGVYFHFGMWNGTEVVDPGADDSLLMFFFSDFEAWRRALHGHEYIATVTTVSVSNEIGVMLPSGEVSYWDCHASDLDHEKYAMFCAGRTMIGQFWDEL